MGFGWSFRKRWDRGAGAREGAEGMTTARRHVASPAPAVEKSLQERLRSGEVAFEAGRVQRPSRLASQVLQRGSEVVVTLPDPPFPGGTLVGTSMSLLFLAWLAPRALRFFGAAGAPPFVSAGVLGFLVLVLAILPLVRLLASLLRFQRGGNVLRASPQGLVLEVFGAWSQKRTPIPHQEILDVEAATSDDLLRSARQEAVGRVIRPGRELPPEWQEGREPTWVAVLRRLVPSQGLVVRTRTGLVRFGGGLPDEELRYLRGLVLKALLTPPSS